MEMRVKQTKDKLQQSAMKTARQIEQEMKNEINARLNSWHREKKEIVHKPHPVNKKPTQEKLFDIKPWTIWWYDSGENVGFETGSHVNADGSFFFNRPCIVISKINTQLESDHCLVTILPMSSQRERNIRNKRYLHMLKAENYPKDGKLKGLKKDSYVLCHQIKTIDTKRLKGMNTKRINEDDIKSIREKMKNYIDIE